MPKATEPKTDSQPPENFLRSRTLLASLGLSGALLLGLTVGFFLPRFLPVKLPGLSFNTSSVVRQVQTLSQLVTVKYVMEKVVILDDLKWYGESRLLLLAHGVVKAGIDLSEVKSDDVNISGKRITIRLPPPRIMDAYLDESKTEIIERTTGMLRQFDKDLEQNARRQAVDDIRRAARTSGIVKDARERAHLQLEGFFRQLGFEEIVLTEQ